MLKPLKIVWFCDRKLFGSKLRLRRDRLRDEDRLRSLRAKRESQMFLNYSRPPNSLLDSLCDRHGSDKGGSLRQENPYAWPSHSYTDFFSLLFEPFREQVYLVFECGIGTNDLSIPSNMGQGGVPGASLRVWRDFFPNAEIVGADIDRKVLFNEERIVTYSVDQTDKNSVQTMWERVGRAGFQLMIDDGLHTFEAGKTLFLESIHLLASTGTYIIEDVKHDDMFRYMDFFGALDFQVHFVSLLRPPPQDGRNLSLGDNQLVVIRRSRPRRHSSIGYANSHEYDLDRTRQPFA